MNSTRPWALRLYGCLFEAMTPLWRKWLRRRQERGKETAASVGQRWMHNPPERPQGRLVWGHAVGVGEALAMAGLLKRLQECRPDLHFLITTTARTSGQALARQNLGPGFTHWFAPVDTPSNVERFLSHWQPDLAIWCEMDIWPALVERTALRGTPLVLVNARLSERGYRKRRWGRPLYAPLLAKFRLVWAQNRETAQYLAALGARIGTIEVTGTIKAMAPPLAVDEAELARWKDALGSRPIWVLASSHEGEEELALAVHARLLETHPDALLILVPRAPDRGNGIAAACGKATPQRSRGERLPGENPCYVADTMGELGLWYRLSRVAMVGGSWTNIGGHNPYEATNLGNVVLHGPFVHNFSESYQELHSRGQCKLVENAHQIATEVLAVWSEGRTAPGNGDAVAQPAAQPLTPLLELLRP